MPVTRPGPAMQVLVPLPKTTYCSTEWIYHPIIHYTTVLECACEYCTIFDREDSTSDLAPSASDIALIQAVLSI